MVHRLAGFFKIAARPVPHTAVSQRLDGTIARVPEYRVQYQIVDAHIERQAEPVKNCSARTSRRSFLGMDCEEHLSDLVGLRSEGLPWGALSLSGRSVKVHTRSLPCVVFVRNVQKRLESNR